MKPRTKIKLLLKEELGSKTKISNQDIKMKMLEIE